MNKLGYWFLVFVGVLMVFMMGYNIYQTFYPFKTIEIENADNLTVLTPRVKAGEDLVYHFKYCRFFKGGVKVYRNLIGPERIPTSITESSALPGCREVDSHLNVPESAKSGTYHMEASAEFDINPQRLIRVDYKTEDFEVYE